MTPKEINKNVSRLIEKIGSIETPIFLNVEPEIHSQAFECFSSVIEKVESDGGEMILGWQIWETQHLIEAEFHAIWKSSNGTLKDITPKGFPQIKQILFLPDCNTKYYGKQVDNIRLNVSDNALVDDLILVCEDIFQFLNEGERANKKKLILTGTEAGILKGLQELQNGLNVMLKANASQNSKCFCDSLLKYEHCHGKNLLKRRSFKNL